MEQIRGLREVIAGKKAILCDLWGVLHNGHAAFPGSLRALSGLRERGLYTILLSNSPKPSDFVKTQIGTFGIGHELFNAIVTSGELAREFLNERRGKSFFFLGAGRDKPTIEKLNNPRTENLRQADYILCTGFFDDWGLSPAQYEAFLAAGVERNIPLICANPDLEVEIRGQRLPCAGALARTYERLGGKVIWLGKPAPLAYEKCYDYLPGKISHEEILVIGDNLETDIKGARKQQISSLFITSGLHGNHGSTKEDLEPFMKSLNIWPDYFMTRLDW